MLLPIVTGGHDGEDACAWVRVYPLREIQQSTVATLEMDGREGPRMPPGILRCRPPVGSC